MQEVIWFPFWWGFAFLPDTNTNVEKALLIARVGVGVAFLPAEPFCPFTPLPYHDKFELSLAIALSAGEPGAG